MQRLLMHLNCCALFNSKTEFFVASLLFFVLSSSGFVADVDGSSDDMMMRIHRTSPTKTFVVGWIPHKTNLKRRMNSSKIQSTGSKVNTTVAPTAGGDSGIYSVVEPRFFRRAIDKIPEKKCRVHTVNITVISVSNFMEKTLLKIKCMLSIYLKVAHIQGL